MHRLVIRAVEEFLRDTYGESVWRDVLAAEAGLGAVPGAAGLSRGGEQLIEGAARLLDKPADELFEDLGAWLAQRESIRRLLRFSGRDFADFVLSLEELPGRAHFVIPDLDMPRIAVLRQDSCTIRLALPPRASAWTAMLGGLLRAMADDYGALSLIIVDGSSVEVHISDEAFAEGRDFNIGAGYLGETAGLRR